MKHVPLILACSLLPLLAACDQTYTPHHEAHASPSGNYAENDNCRALAQSRLRLYDKPDTYPISAEERASAYNALYSECVNAHQVAQGAAGAPKMPVENMSLADLSPAAGGAVMPPPVAGGYATYPSYPAYPVTGANPQVALVGGQAVPLAALSPSSGGAASVGSAVQTYTAGGYGAPESTVVVVQAPPVATAPIQVPSVPRAHGVVAVPVPPLATGYAPVPDRPTPAPTQQVASYQPAAQAAATPPRKKHATLKKVPAENASASAASSPAPAQAKVVVDPHDPQAQQVLEQVLLKN